MELFISQAQAQKAEQKNRLEILLTLREQIGKCSSIEELVLVCLQQYLSMNLVMDHENEEDGTIFVELKEKAGGMPLGCVFILPCEWKSWGQVTPLNTDIHSYADQQGAIPDLEWFQQRDKRLRIRVDECEGEVVAPPGSLKELVMSYLLTGMALVEICPEIIEMKNHVPPVAMLKLRSMRLDREEFFDERIAVRLDKLEQLVRKRRMAADLPQLCSRFSEAG